MARSVLIWCGFLLCVLLPLAALGLVTRHAIAQDHLRRVAEADADRGQRVRLALWRMDSEAAALLVSENNRSTDDFRPGAMLQSALPDYVHLHFEVDANGKFWSPELPAETDAPAQAWAPNLLDDEKSRRLETSQRLRTLLGLTSPEDRPHAVLNGPNAPAPAAHPVDVHADGAQATVTSPASAILHKQFEAAQKIATQSRAKDAIGQKSMASQSDNLQKAFAAALSNEVSQESERDKAAPKGESAETVDARKKSVPSEMSSEYKNKADAMPGAASVAASKPKALGKEETANLNEYSTRVELVQRALNRNSLGRQSVQLQAEAESNAPGPQSDSSLREEGAAVGSSPSLRLREEVSALDSDSAAPALQAASPASQRPDTMTSESASPSTVFQGLWLDHELLLVRSVKQANPQSVQGVWLDKQALENVLLAGIRDLLPQASLRPYQPVEFSSVSVTQLQEHADSLLGRWRATPKNLDNAPLSMVGLPWELVPGPLPAVDSQLDSPLLVLLGTAWGGALLAMLAAVFLLRGVWALSERRASFVSSVTHELRTPLTTFRLYSELLADGIVKDESKVQGYLQTLRTEAERLSHLVENVLAYSRIERGSARSRVEATTVFALLDRIVPRLRERAESAGLVLSLDLPDAVGAAIVHTDQTAVEQILFNLVDNAAKYATCPDGTGQLALAVSQHQRGFSIFGPRKEFQLALTDNGPGIARSEYRKLFRPFHKSARDAAHGKPGVGLGLSLSRRLARALGGDLVLRHSAQGACFVLHLPAQECA